ncbi:transglycosylase SLT domain-containing protein, partial [Candidatus Woesearchaeota archaeon]|nr:transglycosylase SLT domain-containing protein [Candidatus Woesearchaeota archaeon]
MKKLFYNKIAKGIVSLLVIVVLLSSILAASIFYQNNITANVIKELTIDDKPLISIKEVNDIKELSQLNEGWYEIRNGYVFYLEDFNSPVLIWIKVKNPEQQNGLLAVEEEGNINFYEKEKQITETQLTEEQQTQNQITGQITGLEKVSEYATKKVELSVVTPKYAKEITDAERKYNLPAGLLKALINVESEFNPNAKGPKTKTGERAKGLGQIMPATQRQYGLSDPYDPRKNIDTSARILSDELKAEKGNIPMALARYNAGGGAVARAEDIPTNKETQEFVTRVLVTREIYKGNPDFTGTRKYVYEQPSTISSDNFEYAFQADVRLNIKEKQSVWPRIYSTLVELVGGKPAQAATKLPIKIPAQTTPTAGNTQSQNVYASIPYNPSAGDKKEVIDGITIVESKNNAAKSPVLNLYDKNNVHIAYVGPDGIIIPLQQRTTEQKVKQVLSNAKTIQVPTEGLTTSETVSNKLPTYTNGDTFASSSIAQLNQEYTVLTNGKVINKQRKEIAQFEGEALKQYQGYNIRIKLKADQKKGSADLISHEVVKAEGPRDIKSLSDLTSFSQLPSDSWYYLDSNGDILIAKRDITNPNIAVTGETIYGKIDQSKISNLGGRFFNVDKNGIVSFYEAKGNIEATIKPKNEYKFDNLAVPDGKDIIAFEITKETNGKESIKTVYFSDGTQEEIFQATSNSFQIFGEKFGYTSTNYFNKDAKIIMTTEHLSTEGANQLDKTINERARQLAQGIGDAYSYEYQGMAATEYLRERERNGRANPDVLIKYIEQNYNIGDYVRQLETRKAAEEVSKEAKQKAKLEQAREDARIAAITALNSADRKEQQEAFQKALQAQKDYDATEREIEGLANAQQKAKLEQAREDARIAAITALNSADRKEQQE